MADNETSADQYSPVRHTESYLDTKGGVPREDHGEGGRDQGENTPHRRRLESAPEEERHTPVAHQDDQNS